MKKQSFQFNNSSTELYFDSSFSLIKKISKNKNLIILTDENVYEAHGNKFNAYNTIIIKSGEKNKTQQTVNKIIKQLISCRADKGSILIGVGGGVVTDITGFVASIYMRGISFAFVPTTLLAMADASIGGKNGINTGVYKNILGVIKQPAFILYDYSFLKTLPEIEWQNGFAEIIKHACIKDLKMFRQLQSHRLNYFKKNKSELSQLVQSNVKIKLKIVRNDEFETGERRLLNFGHTLGHALENNYNLSHGHAISIGMVCAAKVSNQISGFKNVVDLISLLKQYGLPVSTAFDKKVVVKTMQLDKKKSGEKIKCILLKKIGEAFVQPLSTDQIMECLNI